MNIEKSKTTKIEVVFYYDTDVSTDSWIKRIFRKLFVSDRFVYKLNNIYDLKLSNGQKVERIYDGSVSKGIKVGDWDFCLTAKGRNE
jgi:hypothetical protein